MPAKNENNSLFLLTFSPGVLNSGMIQIGKLRLVSIRMKDRDTGKLVVVKDPEGNPEKKSRQDLVERVTQEPLGFGFGPDSKRPLVVRLVAPDQIEFKPYKTTRSVRANLRDLYRYVLMCQAQAENLRKARDRKAKKAERLASRRLASAERRLTRGVKRDRQTEGWIETIRAL